MTQDKSAPAPPDALLARYHAAQAALDALQANGPSEHARTNILDRATKIATESVAAPAIKQRASGLIDTGKPAANDRQWKIRALATVAMFGLTSLLLHQWDRGTPEEKEVAFSAARPAVAERSESGAVPAPAAPAAAPAAGAPPKAELPSDAAPAAKAAQYGAAQSMRREDAPSAVARMKKSDAADAESSMQDTSAITAGRAATLPNAALFAAIRNGDAAAVEQALANGADKNAKSSGTPAVTLCVQSGKLHLVKRLAAAGADLNAPDAQGMSPLAHAQAMGLDAMVSVLLELGAK